MGDYQGKDLREFDTSGDPKQFDTQQRRAAIFEELKEAGHPTLLDKEELARRFVISERQVDYDIEAIAQFIEEELLGENYGGRNYAVFEKAKKIAMEQGDWDRAIEIIQEESQWLEDRGLIDSEPDEVEITWRQFMAEEDIDP